MRFQEETAKLAEVAEGGDMAAIGQQVGVVGKEGCGTCHETFREKTTRRGSPPILAAAVIGMAAAFGAPPHRV